MQERYRSGAERGKDMAGDLYKTAEQGRKRIHNASKYDITPADIDILYKQIQANEPHTAIVQAFYLGVEQGYKLCEREAQGRV